MSPQDWPEGKAMVQFSWLMIDGDGGKVTVHSEIPLAGGPGTIRNQGERVMRSNCCKKQP